MSKDTTGKSIAFFYGIVNCCNDIALRIADRKGSIAVGKDADRVVWSGYPLEFSSYVKEVFLEGEARGGQEAVSLHELYDVHGIEMSKVLR